MIDVKAPEYRHSRALHAAGLAFVIVCNVMVFAPLTLYAGNPDEFSVSLPAILAAYLLPGLIVVIALALVGALFPSAGFRRFIAFLAAWPILFWLQGTILVWDYGVLDGRPIPWLKTGWRGAIDTALWITVLLTALYGFRRFAGVLLGVAYATFAIQLIASAIIVVDHSGSLSKAADDTGDPQQHAAMFSFSPDKNVLHIVMDGFQSDIFGDIIDEPAHAHLRNSLQGFTVFDKNMGTFPYTQLTVPLIASGRVYTNEIPIETFTENAMRGNSILDAAASAGFDVDIAAQEPLRKIYAQSSHTNSYAIQFDPQSTRRDYVLRDAVRLIDLALFRITPHFVKAYIYEDGLWLVQPRFRNSGYLSIRYFAELAFLEQIAAKLRADRKEPVYKLLHVMLSHRPTVGDEHCKYDGIRRTTRSNVTLQARCGLDRVIAVLEAMKLAGIYDSSMIVLMADHGAWIPLAGFAGAASGEARSPNLPSGSVAGMAVPVLAIKPPAANGPLISSDAPTTIADVPATVSAVMGFDRSFEGRNVYEIGEDEERVRTFFNYAYGKNHKNPGYLYTMAEYEVTGDPFVPAAWRRIGSRLPEGRIEATDGAMSIRTD